jgi:RHS repeat-associated protein
MKKPYAWAVGGFRQLLVRWGLLRPAADRVPEGQRAAIRDLPSWAARRFWRWSRDLTDSYRWELLDLLSSVPPTTARRPYRPEIDCLLEARELLTGSTTSNLVSLLNPAAAGQSFSLADTVTASNGGTPTGYAILYDGTSAITMAPLSGTPGNDQATFNVSSWTGGTHNLSAVYPGDANYSGSTSNTVAETVNPAGTSTSVSFTSPIPGGMAYLNATVTKATASPNTPTGTVTFYANGTQNLGSASLNSNCTASISASGLFPGTYQITAAYSGDTNFATSTSPSSPLTISLAADSVSLSTSSSTAVYGQAVTFSSTVSSAAYFGTHPTGTVTFIANNTTLGSTALNAGTANLTVNLFMAPGSYIVTASYSGDNIFQANQSSSIGQTLHPDGTNILLTSNPNPSGFGQADTLTATVTAQSPGGGTPNTGTVTFFADNSPLGTASVNASGIAVLPVSTLSIGTHSLYAAYSTTSPDYYGSPPASNTVTQQVLPATTTSLGVSPAPSVFGQSITLEATVAVQAPGTGTATGTVSFYDGSTLLGTTNLNGVAGSDQATLSVSNLNADTHFLAAVYGGSSSYAGSSGTYSQTVQKAGTTTSLSLSSSTTVVGQPLTFTATVSVTSPGAGTPTGTVTFYDGSTALGNGTVNSSGIATFSTSALAVGSHSITAGYGGDSNFNGSNSGSQAETVQKAGTTTAVTVNPATVVSGQATTLSATVTVANPGSGTPTGTVTFYDGVTALGSASLNGSGIATLQASFASVGSHTISVVYAGDNSFSGSTSGNASLTVNQAATTITLTSNTQPSIYGQSVTFTAAVSVSSPGAGTPTGTVQVKEGNAVLGTGTLSNGTTTFAISSLAVGNHAIVAVYLGDSSFSGSTSAADNQTVNPATTATVVTANVNPSLFGQSVTFTAAVSVSSPGAGTPTGTVQFKKGNAVLGTGTLSNGTTTFTTSSLTVGNDAIVAVYLGDNNFNGSTSATDNETVNADATSTTVSASANPAVFGQTVSFTVSVTASSPGSGTPTGTVTLSEGSTNLGSATLSSGTATIQASGLAVGAHTLFVQYAGDGNFTSSTSANLTETVQKAGTNTGLTLNPTTAVSGQTVTFTAAVSVVSPGTGTPTGTVTFYDGSSAVGSGTVGSGTVTFQTSSLATGSHVISAVYSGDSGFLTSTSGNATVIVNLFPTSTTLVADTSSPVFGQTITLTATVSGQGSGTPTGSVVFFDNGTSLGSAGLNGSDARIQVSTLSVGAHANITASYSGDSNFGISTSSATSVTVSPAATTTTVTSSVPSSSYGQTVTFTATVQPQGPGAGEPTGTVRFEDEGTVLGTATLDGNGSAAISTSHLALGSHNIVAVYGSDGNFSNSSASFNQSVARAVLVITANDTSKNYGDTVTFNGTDFTSTGLQFGQTVGSVSLSSDGAAATANVSSSPYTITVSGATGGTFDANNYAITYVGGHLTVKPVALTITANDRNKTYGQTANFAGTEFTSSGLLNGDTIGSVSFTSNGAPATASVSGGPYTIIASGATGGTFKASNYTITYVKGHLTVKAAALTITANDTSKDYGQTVTFDGTEFTSTGLQNGDTIDSVALTSAGAPASAGVNGSPYQIGVSAATGSSFDTNNYTISYVNGNLTVKPLDTTTSLSSSIQSPVYGESVTFTATETAQGSEAPKPDGTVEFKDGDNVIGEGTLDGNGSATFTTSKLDAGEHTIVAVYQGTSNFNTSTSSDFNETVSAAATTTTLTSNPEPSLYGQSITFTATVTPVSPGGGTPTGTVEFDIDGSEAGTDTLDGSGTATFQTDTLEVGDHVVTAIYQGDDKGNYEGSTSDEFDQAVKPIPTTTDLSSDTNPSVYGQSVTFTATVTAPQANAVSGQPTGTVEFFIGSTLVDSETLDNSGTATYEDSLLDHGDHTVTAEYEGDEDGHFESSKSTNLTQTVNPAETSTTVASDVNPSVYGQPVTFTATVSVTSPGEGTPSGTVVFYVDGTAIGSSELLIDDTARIQTSSLSVGDHNVTAVYQGDDPSGNFLGSTSDSYQQTVNQAAASVSTGLIGNPCDVTQDWVVTATVMAVAPGAGTPTGTVTFYTNSTNNVFDQGNILGTATLSPLSANMSTASLTLPHAALSTGTWIAATYGGDANFAPAGMDSNNTPLWNTGTSVPMPPTPDWTLSASSTPVTIQALVTYPASGPASVQVNAPFSVSPSISVTDWQVEGTQYSISVDWGDGSGASQFSVPITPPSSAAGSFTSQTDSTNACCSTGGGITANHTYQQAGQFTVTITATNLTNGEVKTVTETVTVNLRPFPVKQFVSAQQDTPTTFDLSAIDPDGDQLTYSIFQDVSNGSTQLSGTTVTYTPDSGFSGVDTLLFQVFDNNGGTSNLGVIQIDVAPTPTDNGSDQPPDGMPTVTIANSLTEANAGSPVTLQASDTDPNNAIDDIEWDFHYDGKNFNPDPAGANSLSFTETYSDPGIYLIAVEVTNEAGDTAMDVQSVEVVAADDPLGNNIPNPAASVGNSGGDNSGSSGDSGGSTSPLTTTIQASNSSINVGDSVDFSVSPSGSDPQSITVGWDFNYDGKTTNATSTGTQVSHTFIAPGVYTIAADVGDALGNAIVTTTVSVKDAPTLVILPPADQEVKEGDPVTFDTPQTVDVGGNVNVNSIQWDFDYQGSFVPDSSGGSTHVYSTGTYVAAVQMSDDSNHTALGFCNVQVDAVPPDVSAGSDQTVTAGDQVAFTGTATALSAITDIQWDFNYDEENFVADSSATGNLDPSHEYLDPGTYHVALQVADAEGLTNIDVVTVTVNDVAPKGTVALSSSQPSDTGNGLRVDQPVYFTVSNMSDVDPSITPSVWADWNSDGNFNLVSLDSSNNVSHNFDDPGPHQVTFHVADAEGMFTSSEVTVTIVDPGPTGTFGQGGGTQVIQPTDTVSFTNVTDPSQDETTDGFTYYYQIDGQGFQPSDAPDYTVVGLDPGSTHTIEGYIQDEAGVKSPTYTQQVVVGSDPYADNSNSTGDAGFSYIEPDGSTGNQDGAPGHSAIVPNDASNVQITLNTSGATYNLNINGDIGGINFAPGVTNVTLNVHTDQATGSGNLRGTGNIGLIHLPSNSTLTVGARGDFAGVVGDGTSSATTLSFNNLTGSISGLQSIGQIKAAGSVSNITVPEGIGSISAASVSNVTTETDPNGPATNLVLTLSTATAPTGLVLGNQTVSTYQINGANALTSITDPVGNVTSVQYDANNNPTSVQTPLGTWTFQYDASGNLLQETSPTGVTRTLTYDNNNSVLTDTTTDSSGHTIEAINFTRNNAGQALTETDASGTYTFTYTAGGQVASETDPNGLTLNYVYDANNNLTQLTDSAGGETDYTYNSQNQLIQQVSTASGQTPLVVTFTYAANGKVATETRYGDLAQTVVLGSTQYTYNSQNQVTELKQLDGGGQMFEDYVYAYNAAGQVANETLNGTADASYQYDAQGQVLSDGSRVYTYDGNGNRTMPGYVTGADNTLLSDGTWNYTYDASGQVTGKTNATTGETWSYVYALNGQLSQATDRDSGGNLLQQANYVYNPAGQLVEEDVTTPTGGTQVTKYLWSGTQLYATLDANGNITRRIFAVNGTNQLLGSAGANGLLSLDLTDPLGSVRDVVGPNGTVHANYDAFGNVTNGATIVGQFGWGGLMRDAATGMYQGTLAREYDPTTGRWTSPDPAGLQIGVTNMYVYASNQTTSHKDVSGLWSLSEAWNAATTYVSNAANQAAQAVTEIFRTVVTAAGDFVAKSVDVFKSGVNTVTWIVKKTGEQIMVLGDQFVDAALSTAKSFLDKLDKFGKSFNDLWTQLQNFKDSAKQVLQAIVNDPVGFFTNLAAGVGDGIKNFLNNIGTYLKDGFFQWLTDALPVLKNLPDFPTTWDVTSTVNFLLDFFKLGWNDVQTMVINTLGPSNVALVAQGYEYLQKFIGEAQNAAADGAQGVLNMLTTAESPLKAQDVFDQALKAGITAIGKSLVTPAIAFIGKMFAVPAAGVLSGIYSAVNWIFNSMGKIQALAGLATDVVNAIGKVAQGQTAALSTTVTNFLKGVIPPGIDFLASQLGLKQLPQDIADGIEKVRSYPSGLVQKGIDYVVKEAKTLLGLEDGLPASSAEGLIGKPITFTVPGGDTHQLWVVNQNGHPVIMRASGSDPLDLSKDLPAKISAAEKQKLQQEVNQLQATGDQIITAGQTAASAPKNQVGAQMKQMGDLLSKEVVQETQLEKDLVSDGAVCFGTACFAAETPMRTPEGDKPIGLFREGDKILSRSELDPNGVVEVKFVEEVFMRTGWIWQVGVGGRTIRTTGEHPFWVRDKGWTPVKEMAVGDEIASEDGRWLAVNTLVETGQQELVYNLRVSDYHTYFVGSLEWGFAAWAHNQYAELLRPRVPADGVLPYPMNPVGTATFYSAFTNVRDNGRPRPPANLNAGQVGRYRSMVLQVINRLRENMQQDDTQHTVCLGAVLRNNKLEFWVSGSGDASRVDSKYRAMIRTSLQELGVDLASVPIYWVMNASGTGNDNRQNDAERHQIREMLRLRKAGLSVDFLAIGSTNKVCVHCQDSIDERGFAYAIAVPTASGEFVSGNA